ncbi:hypothetical protein ACFE04_028762 [Oxalis oulophora]
MTLFKFFVIILPAMIEEGKMRCPESFPQSLRNRLSQYVSLRTPSGLSWIVTVVKSSDGFLYLGGPGWVDFATHHSLSFGHFLVFDCRQVDLFEVIICAQSGVEISYPAADLPPNSSSDDASDCRNCEFKKIMTSSDITGKQTIGIPAWFVNENRSWFNSHHGDCSVVAAGEERRNCRISWYHREGRWEAAICSGGWKFAVNKLKPSDGDTHATYVPHTGGRYSVKRLRKAQCPIVERLTNSFMMNWRNNGKKVMAVRIIKHTMEIIHLFIDQKPIQIIIDVFVNIVPREDATRIGSAGVVRREAAIYLLTTGARDFAFRNIKTIVECLADELINAAKGSSNSYCIKKKDEIESVANGNC